MKRKKKRKSHKTKRKKNPGGTSHAMKTATKAPKKHKKIMYQRVGCLTGETRGWEKTIGCRGTTKKKLETESTQSTEKSTAKGGNGLGDRKVPLKEKKGGQNRATGG